jgi:phosphoribosylamine-glycine ligase
LKAAQAAAYAAVEKIHFDGAHFRREYDEIQEDFVHGLECFHF